MMQVFSYITFVATGITNTDVIRLKPTDELTAIAISPKSCPASSFIKTIGRIGKSNK